MSVLDNLTVLVLTYNEEPNIARTLEALSWAPRILVVDSGSTDATLSIAARYPQVRVLNRPFDTFAGQCNFGLSQIDSDWVLSIDADYVASPGMRAEIAALDADAGPAGYAVRFVYCIYGRPLRSTLYPPRCVLYRRSRAHYRDEGHGHRVIVDGPVGTLASTMGHDDRKPLARWLASQQKYARAEALHLLAAAPGTLRRVDRIRLMAWPAPPLVFLYTLIAKGCILDGWAGWLYVLQRTVAETMIALELVDRRLRARGGERAEPGTP